MPKRVLISHPDLHLTCRPGATASRLSTVFAEYAIWSSGACLTLLSVSREVVWSGQQSDSGPLTDYLARTGPNPILTADADCTRWSRRWPMEPASPPCQPTFPHGRYPKCRAGNDRPDAKLLGTKGVFPEVRCSQRSKDGKPHGYVKPGMGQRRSEQATCFPGKVAHNQADNKCKEDDNKILA